MKKDKESDMEMNHSEIKDLDIDTLKKELEEEKNRHLRTLADFDNYRKRVERDAERRNSEAKRAILLDLLGLHNQLEPSLKLVRDDSVAQGLRLIYRQFIDLLAKNGVVPYASLGQPFNPEEQEGLGYVETFEYPEGYVAEELTRGFKMGDEILQPARVRVAKRGL
ncbi:MAG: nucleotide exchange factor GrpE [Firmicutes bacterium]|nr:nucleotide exchange factor GrpE [Bacillota bacterium]